MSGSAFTPRTYTIWEDFRLWLMHAGLPYELADALMLIVTFTVILIFILVLVLGLVLLERKFLGWLQIRPGPNRVGPWGLLQTVADAIKLLLKEDIIPMNADKPTFVLAPIVMFIPALLSLVVIPLGVANINGRYSYIVAQDLDIGLAYLLAISSVGVIGIIMGGWASNNKYSLYGAMRSVAQLISYEVPMVLALVSVALYAGSLRLIDIIHAQQSIFALIPLFPAFIIFLIAGVAETNRAPFDLPEAESELVGGFHTEYSGMKFALFFLAEYINMFTVSALITVCFLGGWKGPAFLGQNLLWLSSLFWFFLKVFFFLLAFIWFRGTFPRIRVDQMMHFAWKFLIPVAIFQLLIVAWGVAYRNPIMSGGYIPKISVKDIWDPKDYTGFTEFTRTSLPSALRMLNDSEMVTFLISVIGFILLILFIGGLFYRTLKGFAPSKTIFQEKP